MRSECCWPELRPLVGSTWWPVFMSLRDMLPYADFLHFACKGNHTPFNGDLGAGAFFE